MRRDFRKTKHKAAVVRNALRILEKFHCFNQKVNRDCNERAEFMSDELYIEDTCPAEDLMRIFGDPPILERGTTLRALLASEDDEAKGSRGDDDAR